MKLFDVKCIKTIKLDELRDIQKGEYYKCHIEAGGDFWVLATLPTLLQHTTNIGFRFQNIPNDNLWVFEDYFIDMTRKKKLERILNG